MSEGGGGDDARRRGVRARRAVPVGVGVVLVVATTLLVRNHV